MADENAILALLQEIRAEQTAMRAEQTVMKAEQTAMKAEQTAMRTEQTTMRADIARIDAKLDRAAARADDAMAAQVRMQTDIAAIRATQEEHRRILAGGVRYELDSLRERVDALEARQRG